MSAKGRRNTKIAVVYGIGAWLSFGLIVNSYDCSRTFPDGGLEYDNCQIDMVGSAIIGSFTWPLIVLLKVSVWVTRLP